MCVLKYSKTNPLLQIWHIFEKAFWFDPLDFYFVSYRQLGVQSQQVFFFFFTCLVYKIQFMLGHISSVKKKKNSYLLLDFQMFQQFQLLYVYKFYYMQRNCSQPHLFSFWYISRTLCQLNIYLDNSVSERKKKIIINSYT